MLIDVQVQILSKTQEWKTHTFILFCFFQSTEVILTET